MSEIFSPLAGFTGAARLFPLTNLVFFPHVMQPLHIFEPRYRQMTADALAGDRLIALVLPKPGWVKDYACAADLFRRHGRHDRRGSKTRRRPVQHPLARAEPDSSAR